MLSTFIKLPFVIKIFILSFLSGRFTQVLLYKFKIIPIKPFQTEGRFHIATYSKVSILRGNR